MKKKQTADHEGGHALIAWIEGFPLMSVTINPMPGVAPGASGICFTGRQYYGKTELSDAPEILTAAKARVLMAGRVADEFFHSGGPGGWQQDFKNLAALMPVDDETLSMHRFCKKHPGDTERFFQKFKKPVVDLLKSKRGRKAAKALSKTLLEVGTLSGQAAVNVFDKAWGKSLPKKTLPLSAHVGITIGGPRTYDDVLINLKTFLFAMEHDATYLQGELSNKQEDHLARVRLYLKLLHHELLDLKKADRS